MRDFDFTQAPRRPLFLSQVAVPAGRIPHSPSAAQQPRLVLAPAIPGGAGGDDGSIGYGG